MYLLLTAFIRMPLDHPERRATRILKLNFRKLRILIYNLFIFSYSVVFFLFRTVYLRFYSSLFRPILASLIFMQGHIHAKSAYYRRHDYPSVRLNQRGSHWMDIRKI